MNSLKSRIVGLVPFGTFFVLTILAFVYCYYGNRVTSRPIQLAQSVYETPWYLLSVRRQKRINMMIRHGEYELYYSGYGIVTCSLETFRLVRQKIRFQYKWYQFQILLFFTDFKQGWEVFPHTSVDIIEIKCAKFSKIRRKISIVNANIL